jgi:hypothetical protein
MAGATIALSGSANELGTTTALLVKTTTDSDAAGFACIASEIDDGTVTGSRYIKALESSEDYRLRVGSDSLLFNHSFEGTVISRDRLTQIDTTATAAQTTGQLTINSGSSVTSGQACQVRTYRSFPLFGTFTTYGELWAAHANATSTNSVSEFGFGFVSGATVQATDGVFFRIIAGGTLRAVVVNNSVDVSAEDITTTNIPSRDGSGSFDLAETNHYLIAVHNDEVEFWINDVLVKQIKVTSTFGAPTQSSQQPLFARFYNSGAASAARQILLRFLNVQQGELDSNKPWGHQLCGMGGGAYQVQPGTTSGPTVTRGAAQTGWPSSTTAQTAGTYTATTAPAHNTLGGYFVTAAVSSLTTDADYPIFSYQNPAGTATLPGKTLYITSVRVSELIAFAAASTNVSLMRFAVGIGSTASATTATEGAVIVAARLIPIGQVFWSATSAIGDTKGGWTLDFSAAPLVCYPGHFVQLIMRHTGTVTSNTLQVTGMAAFIGYHE